MQQPWADAYTFSLAVKDDGGVKALQGAQMMISRTSPKMQQGLEGA